MRSIKKFNVQMLMRILASYKQSNFVVLREIPSVELRTYSKGGRRLPDPNESFFAECPGSHPDPV